jgi:hypothetical protein
VLATDDCFSDRTNLLVLSPLDGRMNVRGCLSDNHQLVISYVEVFVNGCNLLEEHSSVCFSQIMNDHKCVCLYIGKK